MDNQINQIKELAVKCDLLIKKHNGSNFRYGKLDSKLQEFAELIVQECVNTLSGCKVLGSPTEYTDGFNDGLEFSANKIKQHLLN